MPQGLSIHAGLNGVDATQYNGWDGTLVACEFDADDMAALAKSQGFEPTLLKTKDATAEALTSAISDAAGKLERGDVLLLTYSGHGGQVPDTNGDEDDRADETWVLYDRQVVDDELYALWGSFKPGVRIAVFSDSCHSGTVARDVVEAVGEDRFAAAVADSDRPRLKGLPEDVAKATYEAHKDLYDGIQRSLPPLDKAEVGASVILISGCQDNQTSADGDRNGLFTQTLKQVWDDGKFHGGYRTFRRRIVKTMPPWQSPNLFLTGASDTRFVRQRPFTV
jgi:hypothetical protein